MYDVICPTLIYYGPPILMLGYFTIPSFIETPWPYSIIVSLTCQVSYPFYSRLEGSLSFLWMWLSCYAMLFWLTYSFAFTYWCSTHCAPWTVFPSTTFLSLGIWQLHIEEQYIWSLFDQSNHICSGKISLRNSMLLTLCTNFK